MKSTLKKLLLYIPTTALGLWCMSLQSGILSGGFDKKGLLILDNPALMLLWGLSLGVLAVVLILLPRLGADGTYEENFPSCLLSGGVMIAGGLVMGFTGLNGLVPGGYGTAVFTIAAGVCMVVCGVFRMLGKKPFFAFDLTVGLYFVWHLLQSYSGWNADPQLQRYAFQLLAGVAVILFSIHRCRCAAGAMDRRKLVFMGFAGIFLSLVAIPGSGSVGFFLASGLWCAGGMCDLRRLEEPEQAPEEAPETPNE